MKAHRPRLKPEKRLEVSLETLATALELIPLNFETAGLACPEVLKKAKETASRVRALDQFEGNREHALYELSDQLIIIAQKAERIQINGFEKARIKMEHAFNKHKGAVITEPPEIRPHAPGRITPERASMVSALVSIAFVVVASEKIYKNTMTLSGCRQRA